MPTYEMYLQELFSRMCKPFETIVLTPIKTQDINKMGVTVYVKDIHGSFSNKRDIAYRELAQHTDNDYVICEILEQMLMQVRGHSQYTYTYCMPVKLYTAFKKHSAEEDRMTLYTYDDELNRGTVHVSITAASSDSTIETAWKPMPIHSTMSYTELCDSADETIKIWLRRARRKGKQHG